jgi:hypothetical protein
MTMKRSAPPSDSQICYSQKHARAASLFGWTGAILFLLAYGLLSLGVLSVSGHAFHLMNVLGAVGMIIEGMVHRTIPVILLNISWLLIALIALARLS